MGLRGYAGTGKTTLLKEFRMQLENLGVRLVALAPSADASRGVLRDEGFKGANTIARFLLDSELQRKARGHVLLIDEAGLIGNRDMERLFEIVGPSTRILLSGDVGQNPPVSRGNFLSLLERYSGLDVFTVRQIHRQQEQVYRRAVEAMAEGDLETAFSHLEAIGAIVEIEDDAERYRQGAAEYARCVADTGLPPLVVSPTHSEARLAVDAIRMQLRELGHLGSDHQFTKFNDLKLTTAEKSLPEIYTKGLIVKFHQNAPGGIKRGSNFSVIGMGPDRKVLVESASKERIVLDLSKADRFRVFQIDALALAEGDRIKITNGGRDLGGRRLENGKVSSIKTIGKDGTITLANGYKLSSDFSHWSYAYATAYSSQGKKASDIQAFLSARSSKAASLESFYVTISRGEHRLRIFTDNVEALKESVAKSSRRESALEFTGLGERFFMSKEIKGKDWSTLLAKSRGTSPEKIEGFVKSLAHQRKLDPSKDKKPSHVELLEIKKSNSTSDGKSRSKGRPDKSTNRNRQKRCPMIRVAIRSRAVIPKSLSMWPASRRERKLKPPNQRMRKIKASKSRANRL